MVVHSIGLVEDRVVQPGERQFLLACGKGEGLFFARGNHIALRVVASPQEHALATTDPAWAWSYPNQSRSNAARAMVSGQVVDTITNIKTVKLFAHASPRD
mgnify:CR=1 FL=1